MDVANNSAEPVLPEIPFFPSTATPELYTTPSAAQSLPVARQHPPVALSSFESLPVKITERIVANLLINNLGFPSNQEYTKRFALSLAVVQSSEASPNELSMTAYRSRPPHRRNHSSKTLASTSLPERSPSRRSEVSSVALVAS